MYVNLRHKLGDEAPAYCTCNLHAHWRRCLCIQSNLSSPSNLCPLNLQQRHNMPAFYCMIFFCHEIPMSSIGPPLRSIGAGASGWAVPGLREHCHQSPRFLHLYLCCLCLHRRWLQHYACAGANSGSSPAFLRAENTSHMYIHFCIPLTVNCASVGVSRLKDIKRCKRYVVPCMLCSCLSRRVQASNYSGTR